MAQTAFRLMYQKSQHQVAFPLDTYRLLVQYLGLQLGHQLLHIVQALDQSKYKIGGVSWVELKGVWAAQGFGGESTKNTNGFKLRLQLRLICLRAYSFQVFTEVQATQVHSEQIWLNSQAQATWVNQGKQMMTKNMSKNDLMNTINLFFIVTVFHIVIM